MITKSLNNHSLINVYKNYKNCLMKILKYTETKYYENKIKNNNIKNTWPTLNKVIANNKNSGTIIDNKLTDLQNSYFSNIGVELNKNIQYSNKNIYENITSKKSYIFIKPVSSIEIENIVYNFDSKYSTDSHDFNFFLYVYVYVYVITLFYPLVIFYKFYLINALKIVFTLMYLKHLKL